MNRFLSYLLFWIVLIIGCTPKNKPVLKEMYPEEVVNLGVQEAYDKAKWELYRHYSQCSVTLETVNDNSDTILQYIPYVTLPARSIGARYQGDTLLFHFLFSYSGQVTQEDPRCEYLNGLGFIGKSTSVDLYEFADNYYTLDRDRYQLVYDQVKVENAFKKAINDNYSNLNPWLLDQVEKTDFLGR